MGREAHMRLRSRANHGQAMVEFALAIPFMLLVLIAMIYFGKAFLVSQSLALAAQEGARKAARTPNLSDPSTREQVRNTVLGIMGGARLLSQGDTGTLPAGASVRILPWESDGSTRSATQPGTVGVLVEYPYSLLINPFTGTAAGQTTQVAVSLQIEDPSPIPFEDFRLSEKAICAQEVYQEVN